MTHTSFFVMYNYKTTEIDEVFDNTSLELLDIYKRSSMLVGNISDDSSQYLSSPGNNIYAHDLMEQLMLAVRKARNGGSELAVKRVVSGLPHNSQSFFETPLFDHSLFLWDDKIVSSYDRIRLSSEFPLKFYNRKSGRLLFKIDPQEIPYGSPPIQNYANSQSKKTITFIFHPTDPFCITQQSSRTQSNLNIHFKAS